MVTFKPGTTMLGTATLSGGTAMVSTAKLPGRSRPRQPITAMQSQPRVRNRQPDSAVGDDRNPPDFRRFYHTLVGSYSTWVLFTKSRPCPMLLIEQHLGEG
jgi:hypothetical protein